MSGSVWLIGRPCIIYAGRWWCQTRLESMVGLGPCPPDGWLLTDVCRRPHLPLSDRKLTSVLINPKNVDQGKDICCVNVTPL